MRVLTGPEHDQAMKWLEEAAKVAKEATCIRSRCGSVIVSPHGLNIAEGYNSPPCKSFENAQAPLVCRKDTLSPEFKSDKTCCVHAEQRAIMKALEFCSQHIPGSTLYFIRLNENGEMMKAGKPYCTICSKMALDAGISYFVLWHEEGITVYDTDEYNELSFQYGKE